MTNTPPHIFIACPFFSHSNSSYTTMSLVELVKELTKAGVETCEAVISYPDISDLRGFFATLFLDSSSCSHLLFIDGDMAFEPSLIFSMLALDAEVCGAIYRQKCEPPSFVLSGRPNPQEIKNGFLRVDGVGGGVLLIRRDALVSMLAAHPELVDTRIEKLGIYGNLKQYGLKRLIRFFDLMDLPAGRLSEDYSFCRRWTNLGGKIWAAMDHSLTHVGSYGYEGTFSKAVTMEKLQAAE